MHKLLLLLAATFTSITLFAQAPLNALNFDGTNDYVTCPLPAPFTNLANNDFSFEAWMKREAAGRVFFAQVDPSNFATVLMSGANMLFYVKVSNITYTTSVLLPPASEWVHVAATWDASAQLPRLYFNGVLQTGTSGGASSFGVNNIMTIGSRTDGLQPFMGELDEVRIWNVVRTDCEIRSMMHSEPTGLETGLIAHYNFNRGTAAGNNPTFTVLPDQAGLHSGTLNNFALVDSTSNWVASTAPITAVGSQPAYTSSASETICEGSSYLFGTQTLTSTGTYTELFTSEEGCDSLVTLTLNVPASHMPVQTETACSAYTWAQNGEVYTVSGQYTDTLLSSAGCDSILTLDLTIVQPTFATQTEAACGSYTWPQNGQVYTVSGQYTDTLVNAAGCDSIVTLDLTILQATSSSQTAEACGSYTWPQNGATYTESGLYTDTIPNAAGCDSILSLALIVHHGTTTVEEIVSCGPYTWPADGQTYAISGNYNLILQNVHGCDSILTLNLLVHDLPAVTIAYDGTGTLTAATTGTIVTAWIDCATGQPIAGEQGLTFTPAQNGTYAVTVLDGTTFCSDTSACFTVDFVSLAEQDIIALVIAPNPFTDRLSISFAGEAAQLNVYDAQGKLVLARMVTSGEELAFGSLQAGVYFLEVQTGSGRAVKRVVKE